MFCFWLSEAGKFCTWAFSPGFFKNSFLFEKIWKNELINLCIIILCCVFKKKDVIQFWPLIKTLSTVMITRPQILPSIFQQVKNSKLHWIIYLCYALHMHVQVGISVIFDWLIHFVMLGNYTFLSTFADPIIRYSTHSPRTFDLNISFTILSFAILN